MVFESFSTDFFTLSCVCLTKFFCMVDFKVFWEIFWWLLGAGSAASSSVSSIRWSQCHCHHCHLCLRWSCWSFASLLSSFASFAFLMFLESLVSTSQILWSHARLWASWSIHGHVSLLQVLSLSAWLALHQLQVWCPQSEAPSQFCLLRQPWFHPWQLPWMCLLVGFGLDSSEKPKVGQ